MGGHYAVVDFLIKEGADINALNQTSETPLHLAIMYDRRGVQRLLLQKEAELGLVGDSNGSLPDSNQTAGLKARTIHSLARTAWTSPSLWTQVTF